MDTLTDFLKWHDRQHFKLPLHLKSTLFLLVSKLNFGNGLAINLSKPMFATHQKRVTRTTY